MPNSRRLDFYGLMRMAADKTPGDLHQIQPKSGCFAPGWLNWCVHTECCVHEAQHSPKFAGRSRLELSDCTKLRQSTSPRRECSSCFGEPWRKRLDASRRNARITKQGFPPTNSNHQAVKAGYLALEQSNRMGTKTVSSLGFIEASF